MYNAETRVVIDGKRRYICVTYQDGSTYYALVELFSSLERDVGEGSNPQEAIWDGIRNINSL